VSKPTYLGCYKDTGASRDLFKTYKQFGQQMTPSICFNYCSERGYKYAGLQVDFCFCDNKFGSFGPATNCNYVCFGDRTRYCGGEWANHVYELPVTT
jgi:hypothetical protein